MSESNENDKFNTKRKIIDLPNVPHARKFVGKRGSRVRSPNPGAMTTKFSTVNREGFVANMLNQLG